MPTAKCKICVNPLNNSFFLKEMMFGFRDKFEYYECTQCGCIQIARFPENIEKYYPPYYYSFTIKPPLLTRKSVFKRILGGFRIKRKYKKNNNELLNFLKPLQILPKHNILDIGCGSGDLICKLFNLGFENITGIDKYIKSEINHGYEVKVLKKDLSELPDNSYDLLMLHHVLEHMEDQYKEIAECYRLLKPHAYLIVRIPIKNYAWEKYKENWVQLDPPRHYFIHTVESLTKVVTKVGFQVNKILFDSAGSQYWGSELYKRNIPLFKTRTSNLTDVKSIFSEKELLTWEEKAKKLNELEKGDQAIFYLHKK